MILCFCRLSFGWLPVDERDLFERAIHQTGHCHCKKHYKKKQLFHKEKLLTEYFKN